MAWYRKSRSYGNPDSPTFHPTFPMGLAPDLARSKALDAMMGIRAQQDLEIVVSDLEKRSKHDPMAAYNLASYYNIGYQVEQDRKKAEKYYQAARKRLEGKDGPRETYARGMMLFRGWGGPKDKQKAVALLEKAAEMGMGGAWYQLGLLERKTNPDRYLALMEKAAKNRFPPRQVSSWPYGLNPNGSRTNPSTANNG